MFLTLEDVVESVRGAVGAVDLVVDGRYRVLSHLADGGMARVYRARDLRLDRDVALKVMRADLADDEQFVRRFQREAQSAARLSHPHVVAVHDQGSADGLIFLVMELVAGRTLRDLIEERAPVSPREAMDLLEPVLAATAAAHAAGLVHRDLKPENILLRHDGIIKVADFGLARAVAATSLTRHPDLLWGTAAYLAPEQIESGHADPRSDVYSLGLVLIELLTGRRAVAGDTAISMAYQHVHGQIRPPGSSVSPVPAELDDLVLRATHRDPARRPQDARALLALLRRVRTALSQEELDTAPVPHRVDTLAPDDATFSRTIDQARRTRGQQRTTQVRHRTRPQPRQNDNPSSAPADGGFARTSRPARTPRAREHTAPAAPAVPAAAAARAGTARPQRRRRARRGLLVLALLVVLAAAGGATWWFVDGPGARSIVPSLAGLSAEDAEQALLAEDLRGREATAFSETVPAGTVIAGSPEPGTEVRHDDVVEVTVSRGPERFEVPTLVGGTEAAATEALAEQNLVVGRIDRPWSETAPEGQVIASDPGAGQSLRRDATVHLTVSRGPQPIEVPAVAGTTEQEAVDTLTQAGLEPVVAPDRVFDDEVPEGSVVAQDPSTGTLFAGDTVTLTISQGPELFEVPSVVGMPSAQAEQVLRDAGFEVTLDPVLGSVILDQVYSMSVGAGERVPAGTVIELGVV